MTHVTLEDIATLVDLSPQYRFPGDEWATYDATISRRGIDYPIGEVTVYDDKNRGVLVIRHHTLRTVAQRKVWGQITDMYGMARPQPWQTAYAMAPSLSY